MPDDEAAAGDKLDKWKHGPPKDYLPKRYKWIKHIGSGGYGDVIEVLHLGTNTLMAMKLLRRDPAKGIKEDAYREINNISRAGQHVNIAIWYDFYGAFRHRSVEFH